MSRRRNFNRGIATRPPNHLVGSRQEVGWNRQTDRFHCLGLMTSSNFWDRSTGEPFGMTECIRAVTRERSNCVDTSHLWPMQGPKTSPPAKFSLSTREIDYSSVRGYKSRQRKRGSKFPIHTAAWCPNTDVAGYIAMIPVSGP